VRLASFVALLAVWQVAAWALTSESFVADQYQRNRNAIYFPSPVAVGEAIWHAATHTSGLTRNRIELLGFKFTPHDLVFNIYQTLHRAAVAFVIAMVLGGTLGMALGRIKGLNRFFDGWLLLGLNMPALVIGILCYIWLGLNDTALIIAVVINKVPLVAVTTREGAAAVQPDLLHVARAFRLSRWQTLRRVFLPQLYPYFMVAARNGIALIWKIVLVYELLGRSNGVGFMLANSFSTLDVDLLLAYAFSFIGVVMLIEAFIVRPLERRATRWRM
jgi:NitT/TauT family transport system permease protein